MLLQYREEKRELFCLNIIILIEELSTVEVLVLRGQKYVHVS